VLGKFLQVRANSSFLITTGTAICGGSAIAAIGPILQADEKRNGGVARNHFYFEFRRAADFFRQLDNALHLSQSQFGLWAALAIHDTSSVVGAATKYGERRWSSARP